MSDNQTIVRDFISAWSRLDAQELADYFTEDGIYHNIPVGPVSGRAALKDFIAGFAKDWSAVDWEVRTLICAGDVVIAERVDRMTIGGKPVELPCCGVFEMAGGKIKAWRDYFDLNTYTQALAG